MAATRATVTLCIWPPPTLELHALLAALNETSRDPQAEPARAFQHLNDVEISFWLDPVEGVPMATLAQRAVHRAMAKVYEGQVRVKVELATLPAPRSIDVRPQARLAHASGPTHSR